MSLQMSYEQSTNDHFIDLRSILSRNDCGGLEKPQSGRRVAADVTTLSLEHLDVALAVTAQDRRAGESREGASFKVSARRFSGASGDAGHTAAAANGDDPVIQRLFEALAAAVAAHDRHSGVCADALRLAILTRQFSTQSRPEPSHLEQPVSRNAKLLQKWRLKRVLEYVDDRLDAKITLQDLATIAGLSRMHFAAQFRAATGLRPHQYLLKRRIERAEELLKQAEASLVDVALMVGFQTQAHFTTVFKRFAGTTPYQWRSAYRAQCIPVTSVPTRVS
jgi:AraC-like DNA-binding protein